MTKFALLIMISLLCACHEESKTYNGYIDADLTYLSSNFAGRLTELFALRGQGVKKDQCLFKLEQTSEVFDIEISQLNKKSLVFQEKEIESQLQYSNINYQRTLRMRKQNAASQNDLDMAKKDLDVLKNQLESIQFQIKGNQVNTADKQWQLKRKENHATQAGIIFDTYFTQGEYVQEGLPVLSLITRQNIKVIFFVPEKELSHILLNDTVTISSDGNPHLAKGTINYISNIAQYTPPIIYSREERQELVFRVEARVNHPNLNQIHLGQPVTMGLAK